MTDSKRDWASIDADSDAEEFVEALDEEAAGEDYLEVKLERHELMGVAEGDNVLDVGCGQGIDVRLLSSRVGAEGSVLGFDASETMLEAARERTEGTDNVRFERGDALDLGFADDRFDAVKAERVLCHLETPMRALSEFVRVTVRVAGSAFRRSTWALTSWIRRLDTPSRTSIPSTQFTNTR